MGQQLRKCGSIILIAVGSALVFLFLCGWKPSNIDIKVAYVKTQSCNSSQESTSFNKVEQLLPLPLTRYHFIKQLINDKLLIEFNSYHDMFHLLLLMDDNCSNLFIPEFNSRLVNSDYYKSKFNHMALKLKTVGQIIDGHIGSWPMQAFFYILLARQSWVHQVCEIGFNAGHSAFFWLASNNRTRLLSFDIGGHKYANVMAEYMKSAFPGRFHIVWGDSTKSVPDYLQSLTSLGHRLSCDVIVIDGNHSFKFVSADIENMRAFASVPHHIVIIDDTPCVGGKYCAETARAMKEMKSIFKPVFGCIHYHNLIKGFSVGYYDTESK